MTKSLSDKIANISDYVKSVSRPNNKHREFFRLVDGYEKGTLNKLELVKLKELTNFFIAERKEKLHNKKIKRIEQEQRRKEKTAERKRYEHTCFILGGALLKLKSPDTDMPELIRAVCFMYIQGLISDKQLEIIGIKKYDVEWEFDENYFRDFIAKLEKGKVTAFRFSMVYKDKNEYWVICPYAVERNEDDEITFEYVVQRYDNEGKLKSQEQYLWDWHKELGFWV